jgi:hypothetical protein
MKKSKIMLVSALAVLLCFMCVTSTTFSWFTRPNTQTGSSLSWSDDFAISNGAGISYVTYESTDSGKTYTTNPTTYSDTLSSGGYKYYRTDITNSGTAAQNVSLYLKDLAVGNSGMFYLGVNGPLKTYKCYGESITYTNTQTASTIAKQNVYLGLHNGELTDLKSKMSNGFIHGWGTGINSSDCTWSDAVDTGKTGNWNLSGSYSGWSDNQYFRIYAFKIDYGCSNFMLNANNNTYYSAAQPAISSNNTIIYFEYDGNYNVMAETSGEAAGINTYYSAASLEVGKTRSDIVASGKGTITYKSANTSIATVDQKTGLITGKEAGTTTITATSTGAYGDTITATCEVTVYKNEVNAKSFTDVPIVTNLKVAAASGDNPTTETVYWYIKNDTTSGDLTYTVSKVYLTL